MPLEKTAITIPGDLLKQVDRIARERKTSRSAFITTVLERVVRARRDAEITRALDELFREPEIAAEQRRATDELEAAGTRWDDEQW